MASMSSYLQAHQQMHLPGVLVPLTNGRFQFKIVSLHGVTSKNTYMYPSEIDHKVWFVFYMLEKRASSAEVARKLTKGDHNIMSNGKVMYPKFKISINSELVTTTQNHIMEVHGPNPKGLTTSCYYMIAEFDIQCRPSLSRMMQETALSCLKCMISSIKTQPGMMIPESWCSIFRQRRGIIQPSTTQRRRIPKKRIIPATGDYFSLLHCFPCLFAISQPIILVTYATEVIMLFTCPKPLIVPTCLMGAAIPTHPTGAVQATIIACTKVPGLRPFPTDTHRGVQGFKTGTPRVMVHLWIDATTTTQNCYTHFLVNGPSHLSAIAIPLPRHVTET